MKRQTLIELYNKYYNATVMNADYIFNPTHNELVTADKFLSYFEKKYNNSFSEKSLVWYLEFQFGYWIDKNTAFGVGVIMFNWIVGKKAIERWEDRKNNGIFYRSRFRNLFKVDIKTTETKVKTERVTNHLFTELSSHEEFEKTKFYNKPEGLMWCINLTTLYNEKSQHCLNCVNSIDCINVQRKLFNNVYTIRNSKQK